MVLLLRPALVRMVIARSLIVVIVLVIPPIPRVVFRRRGKGMETVVGSGFVVVRAVRRMVAHI